MAPRWFSLVVLCLLYHYCLASTMVFQANPEVVHPVLSKTLELRCSVDPRTFSQGASQPLPPLVGKRQLAPGVYIHEITSYPKAVSTTPTRTTITSAVSSSKSYTTTTTATSTTTFPTTTTSAFPTTTTTPTPPPDIDAAYVTSIIISRQDPGTYQLETLASVSSYGPATLTSAAVGDARVTGDTEFSPVSPEQGYLSVTWDYPLLEQTGSYVCEVSALDSSLHPVTVTGRVTVTMSDPALEDVVDYVVNNDRYISQLQNLTQQLQDSLEQLQNSQSQLLELQDSLQSQVDVLQEKTANMSAQNIQTGTITQCRNNNYEKVIFPIPYNNPPSVFYSHTASSSSSSDLHLGQVNTTGFSLYCSGSYITTVDWLAIDV